MMPNGGSRSQALCSLGLERIRLVVFVANERAFHVYQQCGFKEYHRNKVDIFMDIRKEGGAK